MKFKVGDLLKYSHPNGTKYYCIVIKLIDYGHHVFWIHGDRPDDNTSYIYQEAECFEVISK
jgi:hypothetical protein